MHVHRAVEVVEALHVRFLVELVFVDIQIDFHVGIATVVEV